MIIAALAVLIIGVAAVLFLVFGRQDSAQSPAVRGDADLRLTYEGMVEVDGKRYVPKKGLTTVLVMGVDHRADTQVETARQGGQADFLQVLVVDDLNRTVRRLPLDRDTMTEITVLSILGEESGTRVSQLCLAHGFGDGKEQSCELTAKAVSNLLGYPISSYVAMNMDGISNLNDYVGGITVTLEDDFSEQDPAMTPGTTLTLHGDQAEYYVRTRRTVGDGTNEARMARQENFINKLTEALYEKVSTESAISDLLDTLSPYLVTNLSNGTIVNTAYLSRDYTTLEPLKIQGSHSISEWGYMQFFPEETSLQAAVLELFYTPVE